METCVQIYDDSINKVQVEWLERAQSSYIYIYIYCDDGEELIPE
jgi:hypothetical protein